MPSFLRSQALFEEAQQYLPGGVNSPVRAFQGVGGTPVFIKRGQGPYLFDEDNQPYVDYVGAWGPMILGHQDPDVKASIQATLENGLAFGTPTQAETTLAKLICSLLPSIQQLRLMNSGTEATMTALRLARGYTQRDLIVKFEGCYHGHSDNLLIKAGSGALTLGQPTSAGVLPDVAKHTHVLPYNDLNALHAAFAQYGNQIAAVIVEPVAANMNCILPHHEFLPALRQACDDYGTLLIFDEVITGFRVALGGAQSLYQIQPDLTTLGKIIGGGLPIGALGGKRAIMQYLAPIGPVYQAGTLSGNPLAVAAGLATLTKLSSSPDFYTTLKDRTVALIDGFKAAAAKYHTPLQMNWTTGLFGLFFTKEANVTSYEAVQQCDVNQFKRFFHGMLAEGIYFAPSAFESAFISIAHNESCIEKTSAAAEKVFSTL